MYSIVTPVTRYVQTILQTILQTMVKTIFQSEIVQSVCHSNDTYRMLVYVTQQTQQLPSQLDIRMNQLVDHHERQFKSLDESVRLVSIAIDRLTNDVDTNNQTMVNVVDKITASVTTVSEKLQNGPDLVSLEKLVYIMRKESTRMSTVLIECHMQSKGIRDVLTDVRRSRVLVND